MSMDWLRLHHGTSADPKWRTVSRRSKQPVASVLAVWIAMLECASQAETRGHLEGWDDEDVAVMLDLEPEQVQAIRDAMQGKTLDGDTLTGWERRQAKSEYKTSTERVKRYRDRKKNRDDQDADEANETPCNVSPVSSVSETGETPRNAMKRDVTTDKIREDKIREDKQERAERDGASAPKSEAQKKAEIVREVAMQCFDLMGWDRKDPTKTYQPVHQWIADGASADLITETVKSVMEKKKGDSPGSLAYFTPAIVQALKNRPEDPLDTMMRVQHGKELQWRNLLKKYKEDGFWLSMKGPKPFEAGCMVPAHLLKEFFPDAHP